MTPAEGRRFVDGELFFEVFPTAAGWMSLFAEVRVQGSVLYLDELDYVPLATKQISIGVGQNLAIRRELMVWTGEQGYTSVVFGGLRISGRNPNRAVAYERKIV